MANRCRPQRVQRNAKPANEQHHQQEDAPGSGTRIGIDEGQRQVDEAAAERQQLRLVGPELVDHPVVRQHHRQAARDRQHAQRDDERRHADVGDQDAVEGADQQRRAERQRHRQPDRHALVHRHADHHARQHQHRADRQVDAAGDDDGRHADRDDGDEGEVARHVEQVLLRGEDVAREAPARRRRAPPPPRPRRSAGWRASASQLRCVRLAIDSSRLRAMSIASRLVQERVVGRITPSRWRR